MRDIESEREGYIKRAAALREAASHIERLLPKSDEFPERCEFLSLLRCMISVNLMNLSELPSGK